MWPNAAQWQFELGQFFYAGGWVLYAILAVGVLLATLLLERAVFRCVSYPRMKQQLLEVLTSALDWRQQQSMVCDVDLALKEGFALAKTLIALCPLIGLLGTVIGMVHVFDALSISGTSDSRMMASGIARASFPTMSGMAVAVLGVLAYSRLQQWADTERRALRQLRNRARFARSSTGRSYNSGTRTSK